MREIGTGALGGRARMPAAQYHALGPVSSVTSTSPSAGSFPDRRPPSRRDHRASPGSTRPVMGLDVVGADATGEPCTSGGTGGALARPHAAPPGPGRRLPARRQRPAAGPRGRGAGRVARRRGMAVLAHEAPREFLQHPEVAENARHFTALREGGIAGGPAAGDLRDRPGHDHRRRRRPQKAAGTGRPRPHAPARRGTAAPGGGVDRRLLDELEQAVGEGDGTADLRRYFALPLPMGVISELLGTETRFRDRLHRLGNRVVATGTEPAEVIAANRELAAVLGEIAAAKAAAPVDGARRAPGAEARRAPWATQGRGPSRGPGSSHPGPGPVRRPGAGPLRRSAPRPGRRSARTVRPWPPPGPGRPTADGP